MLTRSTRYLLKRSCLHCGPLQRWNGSSGGQLKGLQVRHNSGSKENPSQGRELSAAEIEMLKPMLRVNQAGEIGANYIYMGQHLVFKRDKKLEPLIKHMWDQEKVHLEKFDHLIAKYNVRPTVFTPIWKLAGLTLGISTALLGKEAAMACTEAVETVIGEHYNDQLRDLGKINTSEMLELRKTIKNFRNDELEHLETAIQHDSHKAPLHAGLNFAIQAGCKTAIWVAQRF